MLNPSPEKDLLEVSVPKKERKRTYNPLKSRVFSKSPSRSQVIEVDNEPDNEQFVPQFGNNNGAPKDDQSLDASQKKGALKRVFGFISSKGQQKLNSARQHVQERKSKKKDAKWEPDIL